MSWTIHQVVDVQVQLIKDEETVVIEIVEAVLKTCLLFVILSEYKNCHKLKNSIIYVFRERIEHIPFNFDPISILPLSQQTELLFSMFIESKFFFILFLGFLFRIFR